MELPEERETNKVHVKCMQVGVPKKRSNVETAFLNDVKTTFLSDDLEEQIAARGFLKPRTENLVCRLKSVQRILCVD